jgi:hypothetical protein
MLGFEEVLQKLGEQQLDQVSSGEKSWSAVCAECMTCVDRLLHGLESKGLAKCAIPLTNNANNANKNLCKLLGKHNGDDLFLRTGRYGPYLTWGDKKQSLSHLKHGKGNDANQNEQNDNVDNIPITYDEAIRCIENNNNKTTSSSQTGTNTTLSPAQTGTNPSILREINAHASVRNGQYGAYIYYKTPKMKTPAFVSLRGFKEDWKTCDTQLLDAWTTTTPVKKR